MDIVAVPRVRRAGGLANWVRSPLASRLAWPVDAFRVAGGVALGSYFVGNLLAAPSLGACWRGGLLLSLLAASGVASRLAALGLLWTLAFGIHGLAESAHAKDYLAAQLAFWLVILPIGRTLKVAPWAGARPLVDPKARVGGAATSLMLLSQCLLQASGSFWRASVPGWVATPTLQVVLAALPVVGVVTGLRWPVAVAHVGLHLLLCRTALASASLMLMPAAFLYLSPAAPAVDDPRRLDLFGTLSGVYLLVLGGWLGPGGHSSSFVRKRCGAVLADLGLAPALDAGVRSAAPARRGRVVRPDPVAPTSADAAAPLCKSSTASDTAWSVPASIPVWPEQGQMVGSQRCRGCHAKAYERWSASAHARTLSPAAPATVRGMGAAAVFSTDRASLSSVHGAVRIEIESSGHTRQTRLDLALGAGEREQVFLTRSDAGEYLLEPLIWSERSAQSGLARAAEAYPEVYGQADSFLAEPRSAEAVGCFQCHATGLRSVRAPDPYAEAAVGCEACHGPGAAHVRAKDGGDAADPYAGWVVRRGSDDVSVCGGCHGLSREYTAWNPQPGALDRLPIALEDSRLGADGRSARASVQLQPLETTPCRTIGHVTCTACHAPHDARGSESVVLANASCARCHATERRGANAGAHSRHGPTVLCTACHMPSLEPPAGGGPRSTDHAISIPRVAETSDPRNACLNCHRERTSTWVSERFRDWGAASATKARDWVERLATAKDPQSRVEAKGSALRDLLSSERASRVVELAALRLLRLQPPDPSVVELLRPRSSDERSDLRAASIDALVNHDRANATDWMLRGLHDADPLVRLEVGSRRLPWLAEHEAELRIYVQDVLDHTTRPPTDVLEELATLERAKGDGGMACTLLGFATHFALPSERPALRRLLREAP